jgi:hypothetical protein
MCLFFLIFYAFCSTKSENRRAEQILLGVATGGRGEVTGKGIGG